MHKHPLVGTTTLTNNIYADVDDDDDNTNPFIITFALSAFINLLLVVVITLTCLLLWREKKTKPVHTNDRYTYKLVNNEVSHIVYILGLRIVMTQV